MELWSLRMRELKSAKTSNWNESDMRDALKSLKNNKAADPHGMIHELFKVGCIGSDLEKALLLFFNLIKTNQSIPEYILSQNISSIYKKKRDLDSILKTTGESSFRQV